MESDPETRRVLFICGLHRSGTSLLHEILAEHPDVSAFRNTGVPKDEGQHLQTVYKAAKSFGGPGRFGFDPNSYLDETSPLCTPANRKKLWTEWARHWDTSKAVLVEKSPPNLVRTRFLQWNFPRASFVVVLRDPRVVALATAKWAPGASPDALFEHWFVCHDKFERDRRALRRVLLVRYEDLVSDVFTTAGQLFEFAGLAPHRPTTPTLNGLNERYLKLWAQSRLDHQITAGRAAIAGRYGYLG